MKVYQHIEVDEETPVAFVAVHPLRWRSAWGEPTAMFKDINLIDVPEVKALVDAGQALYWRLDGFAYEGYEEWDLMEALKVALAALATFKESTDAD